MQVPEKLIFLASLLASKLINGFRSPASLQPKRILLIKLDEIGDMVNTVHVFVLLKEQYPEASITVWCKAFCKTLIENDPHLERVVSNRSELNGRYDLIIDLRGTLGTVGYAIKQWPSYRLDRGTIRLRNKLAGGHPHEVQTNIQIIAPVLKQVPDKVQLQLYPSEKAKEQAKQFIRDKGLQDFALIHVGARKALRRWPAERFAALASYLHKEKSLGVVFVGDTSDAPIIEAVQAQVDFATYSTVGVLDLMGYAALLASAGLFVGNESGPLHIAAAMRTPAIGLFGPGEPITFYPYGEKSRYVHHVLACNPCDQVHCVCPNDPCIQHISLAEVIALVDELI